MFSTTKVTTLLLTSLLTFLAIELMDMEPITPAYQAFAEEMGPILWSEIIRLGVKNPRQAYKNMIMLLGYESKYGTTRLAKELNNYGGVGYNDTTKTYNSYKDKKHFAKDYVRLMNSRYKNAILAKTLNDYAKQIRDLGYYTDTLENYSRNLNGMKSFLKAVYNHMQANPDMYQGGISVVKTSDGNKKLVIDPAVYGLEKPGFESTWKPEQPTKTIYPLNNTTPESISSWSGADAPNATPRLKDFLEVRQEDLNSGIDVYGDPVSPFSLRLRLPSLTSLLQLNSPLRLMELYFADALGISDMLPLAPSLFPRLKNGKLPKYEDGTQPIKTLPPINKDVVQNGVNLGTNPTNATINSDGTFLDDYTRALEQGAVATGTKPLQPYRSSYDPNAIKEFTDVLPVIGDVQQGFEAIDAFNKGKYGEATLLAGLMAAPNFMELPTKRLGKFFYKRLRKLGVNRATAHDLVSNPDGVMDALLNGDDYPLTQRLVDKLTRKYNKQLSKYQSDVEKASIKYELGQRAKRLADHGVTSPGLNKIWPSRPKTGTFATYRDPHVLGDYPMRNVGMVDLNGNLIGNRIEVTFPWLDTRKVRRSNFIDMNSDTYPNGNPQFMLYLGHENTHSLDFDSDFAPYLSLSGKFDKRTKYYTSDFTNLYGSKITRREGNPFIGSINSRNKVNRALAESDALGTPKSVDTDYFDTYGTDVWRSDASEAVADLRGAITAGWSEADIYKLMLEKHNMTSDMVDLAIKMGYKDGKTPIRIKPANRGKLTRLKKRTGKSEAELYRTGSAATRKMITFARNARKWKH